jgi:predicted exporter
VETIDLLASPAGFLVKSLLVDDPTGETAQIANQLDSGVQARSADGVWVSQDGQRALLMAQTRAAGSDIDGQQHAVDLIRRAFTTAAQQAPHTSALHAEIVLSGPGVFAVAARATIKNAAVKLSILSTVLIMTLLVFVYRSVAALVLGLLPVASGTLAGVAAVALGFGVVHGITLAFGITLIGESVDYPIYLFIQSGSRTDGVKDASVGQQNFWKIIGLGVLTSICGFASLLPSAFPGLAQLGLYSIAGLVAAAAVTRFVLPALLPKQLKIRDVTPLGVGIARLLRRIRGLRIVLAAVPILAGLVLYQNRNTIWNRELASLSPVAASDQSLDAILRTDVSAPDVRDLVLVAGPDMESVLQATEQAVTRLARLVDAGVIAGFESPTRYLPSLALQRVRKASLPDAAELRTRLQSALATLPLRATRLEPFVAAVDAARRAPPLTRLDLDGTSFAIGFDSLMIHEGDQWQALLPLRALTPGNVPLAIDVARVRDALADAAPGQTTVLDLKQESDALYSTYLSEALRLSLGGFAAIVLLLLVALRSVTHVARVVAPLILAVLTVAAGLVLVGRHLTILHLIGMLLIVAVGSNYALFFNPRRVDARAGVAPLTLVSLAVANAATVIAFGVLAFSNVPVLEALGSTVAPGTLLTLIFSALLSLPDSPLAPKTSA